MSTSGSDVWPTRDARFKPRNGSSREAETARLPSCSRRPSYDDRARPGGGTGRRWGLKIPWGHSRLGSTPSPASQNPQQFGGSCGLRRARFWCIALVLIESGSIPAVRRSCRRLTAQSPELSGDIVAPLYRLAQAFNHAINIPSKVIDFTVEVEQLVSEAHQQAALEFSGYPHACRAATRLSPRRQPPAAGLALHTADGAGSAFRSLVCVRRC